MSKLATFTKNYKTIHPYKCAFCDKPQYKNANGIVRHVINEHHGICSLEEYYTKFINEEKFKKICAAKLLNSPLSIKWRLDNICAECKSNKCTFSSFGRGYTVFCSNLCTQKNNIINNARTIRAKEKLKEKHGVENPSQIEGVPEKVKETKLKNHGSRNYINLEQMKKTSLKKYGTEYFTQTKQYKEAVKQTSMEKYGVEHFTQSEDVKNKTYTTNMKKYGVKHTLQAPEIREKIVNTNMKKYGTCSVLGLDSTRKKARDKCQEKYGTPYFFQSDKFKSQHSYYTVSSNRYVSETGISVKEWLDKQDDPKPAYSSVKGYLPNESISIEELQKYISSFRKNKTYIEHAISNLFNITHYNLSVANLKYRPDFKLGPQIFVNADGLYWHGEYQKDKWYHFNLRKEFEKAGLRIFQFREDEINNKSQIIKSIVNNSLGKTQAKIFARKCIIKKIPQKEAEVFLNKNHLMNSTSAKHIGLYYNEQLVSILSYKCRKNICKIERFCSSINTNVLGGFSKLLNHLEKEILDQKITEIHNWVDLRYGTGDHLQAKYFVCIKETLGWKWTDSRNTFNRLKCRANMDKRALSQQEHANELKWYKIYDAGQRLWIKNIK